MASLYEVGTQGVYVILHPADCGVKEVRNNSGDFGPSMTIEHSWSDARDRESLHYANS